MRLFSTLSLLLACVVAGRASSAVPAPRYVIDLDLAPQDRWSHIIADYKQDLQAVLKEIIQMAPPEVLILADAIAAKIDEVFPYPYNKEMVGVSIAAEVSLGEVVLGNTIYEIGAYNHSSAAPKACTSIVAEAVNGTVYHGRNFDHIFTEWLRKLTIIIDFQSQGETLYTGTTFAGYVGLATGQRAKGFTVTVNERDTGEWWMNVLEALVAGANGLVTLLVRDTLADPSLDFEGAIENLAYKPLVAPSYIIVGGVGPDHGAVITRDRIAALDIWRLNSFDGRWFLVETNYDHWEPPPKSDDRRDPAIKGMNETGRAGLSPSSLFHVLSTFPVMNPETIYTVTMAAEMPELYSVWIRP